MESLWLYAVLVFGIIALPGMDMAFVLSSTLAEGKRGGAAALLGIVAGGVVHVAMSMLGLGLLLRDAPGLFNALLVAGALYIGWIGMQLWRQPAVLHPVEVGRPQPLARTFVRALTTCLLNPKAYVFMVAVFPQFLRPQAGSLLAQATALSAIAAGMQVGVYGAVIVAAQRLRAGLGGSERTQQLLARGVALLLLGTAAAGLWNSWRSA